MYKHFCSRLNVGTRHLLVSRGFGQSSDKLVVQHLPERGVIRVNGDEVVPFLQGLVTNDLKHLEDGASSMYAMFLNNRGRVLYDAILYPAMPANTILIECDVTGLVSLKKHLNMYKVRRKINIDSLENEYKVWVVNKESLVKNSLKSSDNLDVQEIKLEGVEGVVCGSDPRVPRLGVRVLAPIETDVARNIDNGRENMFYQVLRYQLGVGEGVVEMPPGNCFPMEANADYLHGVSFHKGCYIGQELTARTHHTGVIRKRLMPLLLESDTQYQVDAPITTNADKSCGKLRGLQDNYGLGLLRVNEALQADSLKVATAKASTYKPFWWPSELPKERMESASEPVPEKEEIQWFECSNCKLHEAYDYKGLAPPFFRNITFSQPTYVIKSPFLHDSKNQFIILGSECHLCKIPVCQSNTCSLFYNLRYCRTCARQRITLFPEQIQAKLHSS